ncbi:MAG: methyltransferase domain-containing protein [Solirubrobacteraceae bacterium]
MSVQPRSRLKRVAKRLARPAMSRIDDRVGGVNRRIEDLRASSQLTSAAVDQLSASIGAQTRLQEAYARSASESLAYVGAELRGVHERLAGIDERQAGVDERLADVDERLGGVDQRLAGAEQEQRALHERSLEEIYRSRLLRGAEAPLSELDDTMAYAINYATGYRGFYAQAGMWFNPPLAVSLEAGGASLVLVNERIVEVPFALRALSRIQLPARILDIGSAESTFPLSAASLGYHVTAVDPRPVPYTHPQLESFACRLEDLNAPDEPFAAAFLISTIEHVGLGAYGEPGYGKSEHGRGADLALLARMRALLAPDGLLVLTTPFGARELTVLERVYDEDSLSELLSGWRILERQHAVRRDAVTWEAVDRIAPDQRGIVMLLASPQSA